MIQPEKLRALIARPVENVRFRTPLPILTEVLYIGSNPDKSGKRCSNCYKWVITGRCIEVAGEIEPTMVCGYHVFGQAQASMPLSEPERKLTAADAGLIETPNGEGVCCFTCRFFEVGNEVGEGLCNAVASQVDTLPPVVVDSLGCCTRWEHYGVG